MTLLWEDLSELLVLCEMESEWTSLPAVSDADAVVDDVLASWLGFGDDKGIGFESLSPVLLVAIV